LAAVFQSLGKLGFTEGQIREGALELLHDEEWAPSRIVAPNPDVPAQAPARSPETLQDQPEPVEARREESSLPLT